MRGGLEWFQLGLISRTMQVRFLPPQQKNKTIVMIFNYYPAKITSSTPLGEVTLDRFLSSIKYPKKKIIDVFDKIQKAEEAGDMATKNQLKTHLYSFTPCVYVKGSRKYDNIINFTGIMALDFDHLETEYAKEWKKAMFNEYKFIIAAWLSPSRHGVRAFVKIPICHSVEEFKEYFNALQYELSIYRGWDRACQNCILPLFLSYDYDLLERKDYTTWTNRYIPPAPPPIKQYVVSDKSSVVERIINTMISRITDNGHPQLRAAAYVCGGYVGGGYLHAGEAIQMIEKMIYGNSYLSQKPKVYIKTAHTMIAKGQSKPLFLK